MSDSSRDDANLHGFLIFGGIVALVLLLAGGGYWFVAGRARAERVKARTASVLVALEMASKALTDSENLQEVQHARRVAREALELASGPDVDPAVKQRIEDTYRRIDARCEELAEQQTRQRVERKVADRVRERILPQQANLAGAAFWTTEAERLDRAYREAFTPLDIAEPKARRDAADDRVGTVLQPAMRHWALARTWRTQPPDLAALRELFASDGTDDEAAFFRDCIRGLLAELADPPDWANAVTAYRRALEKQPDCHGVRMRLAWASASTDLTAVTLEALQKLIRKEPRRPELHVLRARTYRKSGNPQAAATSYKEALRRGDDDAVLRHELAATLLAIGKTGDAIRAYRRAIQLDKENPDYWHDLADALVLAKGYDGAVTAYEKCLTLEPKRVQAHADLGLAHALKEDFETAIARYREALEVDSRHAPSWYRLGRALRHEGDGDGSLAAFERATDCDAKFAEAWCALGRALRERGRYVASLDAFRRGHDLGSKRGKTWKLPSEEWVTRGERLARVERRLLPILEGKAKAFSVAEMLDVTDFAFTRRAWLACAKTYADALASQPNLVGKLIGERRERAARAAIRVGMSSDDTLDDATRRRWRDRAHGWLREEFDRWKTEIGKGSEVLKRRAVRALRRWYTLDDLSAVRGKAIGALPKDEADRWRAFWKEVERVAEPLETESEGKD